MESKILSKKVLLIVISAGLLCSVAIFFYYLSKNLNLPAVQFNLLESDWQIKNNQAALAQNIFISPKQEQVTSSSPVLLAIGRPLRLKIPAIDVDSVIESVGLTSSGAMDTPKSFANVAWYNLGQRPGEIGSAVIAGHYGAVGGKASVFDNLHKLQKGDKLYIEDNMGAVVSFVVREIKRYDPNADASSVFSSNDGKSHLNLITCEGVWDEVSQSYSQRLVIFADKN